MSWYCKAIFHEKNFLFSPFFFPLLVWWIGGQIESFNISLNNSLDISLGFFLGISLNISRYLFQYFSSQPFLCSPLSDGLGSKLSLSILRLKNISELYFSISLNSTSRNFSIVLLNISELYFLLIWIILLNINKFYFSILLNCTSQYLWILLLNITT